MKTDIAYHEYIVTANNAADYQNAILWILFAFMIAPVILLFIIIPIKLLTNPRCPNCRSYQFKPLLKAEEKGGVTTTQNAKICTKCDTEF